MEHDHSQRLQEQVLAAYATGKPLAIQGGNSKAWYGNEPQGEILSIAEHQGIINYEPTELVITARAGTRLSEIETLLAEHNQCLAFEPPHFGETATLGGTIACNFSGPARPYFGAARDFVLGCQIINGKGEILNFGGQVMKNVAGYDVSRLMAGALGTLGVLLTISLRVLPKPEAELTLVKNVDAAGAIQQANAYARLPLPISANAYVDGSAYIRLSGTQGAVQQAAAYLGGEPLANSAMFWHNLREHQLGFFQSEPHLWRLSLPADTSVLDLAGATLYDWGGAQRWLLSDSEVAPIRDVLSQAGGHATLFRAQPSIRRHNAAFQPLSEAMLRYQKQLKHAFDPKGIFNPNRLYAGL